MTPEETTAFEAMRVERDKAIHDVGTVARGHQERGRATAADERIEEKLKKFLWLIEADIASDKIEPRVLINSLKVKTVQMLDEKDKRYDQLHKVASELYAALEPFAWCGERIYQGASDGMQFELSFPPDVGIPDAGAWRAAKSALAAAAPLLEEKPV